MRTTAFYAPIDDGRARFGGFDPGTYDLWLDPTDTWAPLRLEGVELGPTETDLGAPAFSRGSTLVFRMELLNGRGALVRATGRAVP